MTGKRKFDGSTYELGESSRSRRSRRLSKLTNTVICDAVPAFSYFDNGDCEYICQHCSSLFWFAERIMRTPVNSPPKYTRCCKGGAVRLPFPLHPPLIIKQLFENANFMENIRAYDNMFSMTSFVS
ncbi:hypothetical protein CASFOL_028613 [Castilleja foliolosa]|uniref:Uncharacterized protein n=1 Tax=Castilleja foliolosa TaxID=1961234 RepID=A0ABD3CEP5_9LAMI